MSGLTQDAAWIVASMSNNGIRIGQLELNALTSCLTRRQISRGTVLFHEGKPVEGVCIIRRGTVELSVGSGQSRRVVQLLHEGDMLGDPYVILGIPIPFTARAIGDTQCLYLTSDSYHRLLREFPSLGVLWLCNAASRLAHARTRMLEVLAEGLPQRVARLLLDEAVRGSVRLPQRTIAEMLGVQRSSVNKALKEFESKGVIELGYGVIRLKDEEGLRMAASRRRRR